MKYLITSVCLLIYFQSYSQTSVVQDSKGESTLALGSSGVVAINSKDESISFSYGVPLKSEGANPDYIGISVKGKGKNGLANIIKNNEFQYDGSIGLFYFKDIIDYTAPYNSYFQIYGSVDLLFSQFKLYNASVAFKDQVKDNNDQGGKIKIGINYSNSLFEGIPYLVGFSINGGKGNNTTDLKTIDISTSTTIVDPVTLNTRLIEKDKSTAYDITEYKNNLLSSNINLDFGPKFLDQYLLLFHSRWSTQEYRKPQWNPAVGLYFTKKDAPLEVVAGIQAQVIDYSNTAASIKTRSERTVINIVAGFNF